MNGTATNGASRQPIDTVLNGFNSIEADSFESDGDRSKALLAAYALVSRLETPWDTVARLCMNQVSPKSFAFQIRGITNSASQ